MEQVRFEYVKDENQTLAFTEDQHEQEIFENDNEDYFRYIFSNIPLNWLAVSIYILGLICCGLLGMVSYFERSGLAGPYRPVINQLTSFGIDQVVFVKLSFKTNYKS